MGELRQEFLLKQLVFYNASEDCQRLIRPQKGMGNIMDFHKSHRNVGTYKHRAQLVALETYVVQKQMLAKCFNCGIPGILKKQYKLPCKRASAFNGQQWAGCCHLKVVPGVRSCVNGSVISLGSHVVTQTEENLRRIQVPLLLAF